MKGARKSRLFFGALLTGNAGLIAACSSGSGSLPLQAAGGDQPAFASRAAVANTATPKPTFGPVVLSPTSWAASERSAEPVYISQQYGALAYAGPFTVGSAECAGYVTVSTVHVSALGNFVTLFAGSRPGKCEIDIMGGDRKYTDFSIDITGATPTPAPTYGPVVLTPSSGQLAEKTSLGVYIAQSYGNKAYTGPFTVGSAECAGYVTVSGYHVSADYGPYVTVYAGARPKSCTIDIMGGDRKYTDFNIQIFAPGTTPTPSPTASPTPSPSPTAAPTYGPVLFSPTSLSLPLSSVSPVYVTQYRAGDLLETYTVGLDTCAGLATVGPVTFNGLAGAFDIYTGNAAGTCELTVTGSGGITGNLEVEVGP